MVSVAPLGFSAPANVCVTVMTCRSRLGITSSAASQCRHARCEIQRTGSGNPKIFVGAQCPMTTYVGGQPS